MLLDVPACYVGYRHASTRRQARTDGGGGEKESSVPDPCSLESVCGQARVYRHIAGVCLSPYSRRVFIAILPGVSLPPYVSLY